MPFLREKIAAGRILATPYAARRMADSNVTFIHSRKAKAVRAGLGRLLRTRIEKTGITTELTSGLRKVRLVRYAAARKGRAMDVSEDGIARMPRTKKEGM